MNGQTKLVTVVVPCYNGAEWIEKCILSLKNQTYKNIEVIIYDNNSSDNSLAIIKNTIQNDSRFSYVRSDVQLSAGESRNLAVNIAKGVYITYLDCDDTFEPDYISSMLSKGDDYDYIVCDWNKVYPNGNREDRIIPFKKESLNRDDLLELQKRIVGENNPKTPLSLDIFSSIAGKLFKLDIIKNHNIMFTSSNKIGGADDALFNIEYLEYCHTGIKINKKLYNYLCNPKSFTHKTQKLEKIDKFFLQYDLFKQFIQKYSKDESYSVALLNRIYIQIFGAFIIAQSSPATKKERLLKLKEYINSPLITASLKAINPKSFSLVFSPFFRAIKHKHVRFCYFYIKLAMIYRNRNF